MLNCRKTIALLLMLALVLLVTGSVLSGDTKDEAAADWQQARSVAAENQAEVDPAVQQKIAEQQKYEAEMAELDRPEIDVWSPNSKYAPENQVRPNFLYKQAVYMAEDFNAGVVPPAGWSSVVTNASFTWKPYTASPFEGAGAADILYDPALVPQDEWLISPSMDLTSATSDVRVNFWWEMSYYWSVDPNDNHDFELWVSTDGGATFPTRLWWEHDEGVFSNYVWYNKEVSLSAYAGQSNVVLAWRYVGSDGAQVVLDLVEVSDAPPATGRCCSGDPGAPDCNDISQAECDALGGDWDETLSCATDACPVAGPGDNCGAPIAVSLPGDFPYSDNNFTCTRLNDYSATCAGSYDGGEDIIYQLTVTSAVTVDITLDPLGSSWTGMVVDVACPPSATGCVAVKNNGSSSAPYAITSLALAPGTYYLMIDTWPTPNCIPNFNLTIAEAAPLNPGDVCADPLKIDIPSLPYSDIGQTTCGRGDDYDATCLGSYDGGDDILYEVTVISEVTVDITLDPQGTTYTGFVIDDVCPPGASGCIAQSTSSGSAAHGVTSIVLIPGTYYIMVATWPSPQCIPTFDLHITEGAPPPPPPANDDWAAAEEVGDVVDHAFCTDAATFDGPGNCQTCPNVWYCYTATCTGNVLVSLCGSGYDTKLAVYDGCGTPTAGNQLACNDDACGLQSEVGFAAVSGNTYLIEVGGWESSSTGCKTGCGVMSISCSLPCQVECPSGASDESEPCGTDTNGGCNSVVPVFTDISCGETVCGNAWYDGSSRDTDWYRLTLDGFYDVTWTVQAEFEALIGPVGSNNPGSGDCADNTGSISPAAFPLACEVGSVTVTYGPGVYFFFVAPLFGDILDCGAGPWDYWASATCVPVAPDYCEATSNTCDEYISNVIVGSINNSTGCTNYSDHTALSTTMDVGTAYPISVTNGNPYSSDQCGIWVDWNQDFDFDDADETIAVSGTPGNGPYSGSITPPATAATGATRMRIRITYTGAVSPCGTTTYGEVEDYTVIVAGAVESEQVVLDPDPIYAAMGRPVEPKCVYVYLGGEFAPGYNVNDVNTSSLLINGSLPAVSTEVLASYPDFTGDVLKICVDMQSFVQGYGILYNSTTQSYTVAGEMNDTSPFSAGDDFTYVGHISGDVNLDGNVNILDLNFLINYIFRQGLTPQDPVEADINADGNAANILDLNFMVNYIFRSGPPPLHLDQN